MRDKHPVMIPSREASQSSAQSSSKKSRLSTSSSPQTVPSSRSSSKSDTPHRSPTSDAKLARKSSTWITQYHDVWSSLTLSSFYSDLGERSFSPSQYARWLLDRASLSITIVEAATRVSEMLTIASPDAKLPLLSAAKENAEFLTRYAVLKGFDINSHHRLSHAARRLVVLIDSSTAPDAPLVVAITAVWAFMFGSWQSWALCCNRWGVHIPTHFAEIAKFLARDEAIEHLVSTQVVLDSLLTSSASPHEFDKAGKTFQEITTRSVAVLDQTLHMSESNQVPLCTCGRKGHLPSQCTFKSHI